MHCFFVTGAVYQLDWSALRMGVLPFCVGELPKGFCHPIMELVIGTLHPVARATGIGTAQALGRRQIDEERDIGDKPARRQSVGGADFRLWQAAPEYLVGVRREKKSVNQNGSSFDEIGQDLPCYQLGTGGHEQKRFSCSSYLLLGMEKNVPDVISDRSPTGLPHRNAWNPSLGELFGEKPYLSCLPRSLGALENNEPTPLHLRKA